MSVTHHLPHPAIAKLLIPRKFALDASQLPFPANSRLWPLILIHSSPFSPQLPSGGVKREVFAALGARVRCFQHCGYFDFFSPLTSERSTKLGTLYSTLAFTFPSTLERLFWRFCLRCSFPPSYHGRPQGAGCHHPGGTASRLQIPQLITTLQRINGEGH